MEGAGSGHENEEEEQTEARSDRICELLQERRGLASYQVADLLRDSLTVVLRELGVLVDSGIVEAHPSGRRVGTAAWLSLAPPVAVGEHPNTRNR